MDGIRREDIRTVMKIFNLRKGNKEDKMRWRNHYKRREVKGPKILCGTTFKVTRKSTASSPMRR